VRPRVDRPSARIELLKRCLHAGLSCGQIAREIGVTRNAVIGKRNRLGLSIPLVMVAVGEPVATGLDNSPAL
jgi:hypothetical protein